MTNCTTAYAFPSIRIPSASPLKITWKKKEEIGIQTILKLHKYGRISKNVLVSRDEKKCRRGLLCTRAPKKKNSTLAAYFLPVSRKWDNRRDKLEYLSLPRNGMRSRGEAHMYIYIQAEPRKVGSKSSAERENEIEEAAVARVYI